MTTFEASVSSARHLVTCELALSSMYTQDLDAYCCAACRWRWLRPGFLHGACATPESFKVELPVQGDCQQRYTASRAPVAQPQCAISIPSALITTAAPRLLLADLYLIVDRSGGGGGGADASAVATGGLRPRGWARRNGVAPPPVAAAAQRAELQAMTMLEVARGSVWLLGSTLQGDSRRCRGIDVAPNARIYMRGARSCLRACSTGRN